VTTLTQLVDRIQLQLNDAGASIWAQTDIEEWAIAGIRDYSIHFPRVNADIITCATGTQRYDLEGDCLGIILVEYPRDEDPPAYLTRLPRTHPDFWLHDTYYDVELYNTEPNTPPSLWISASPTLGEYIHVYYNAYHYPSANTVPPPIAAISVPAHHEHLIEHYVVWQAHVERLNTEIQAPDTTIRLIQQYKLACQSTEAAYRSSLRAAQRSLSAGGWTGPWRVDGHDRIY
jgi:hypothetical protein